MFIHARALFEILLQCDAQCLCAFNVKQGFDIARVRVLLRLCLDRIRLAFLFVLFIGLRLAAFAADRPTEETWARKMEAWNRSALKEWRYKNAVQFRPDCLQAQKRLLAPLPSPEERFIRQVENKKSGVQEQVTRVTTDATRKERKP